MDLDDMIKEIERLIEEYNKSFAYPVTIVLKYDDRVEIVNGYL